MNRYRSPFGSILPRGSVHSRRNTVRLQSNRLCILFGVIAPAVSFAAATVRGAAAVWVAAAVPETASWPTTARHAAAMLALTRPDGTRISSRCGRPAGSRQLYPLFTEAQHSII